MNFETIIIILLSYSLGVFSVWIKRRCERESNEGSSLPLNCPYVKE